MKRQTISRERRTVLICTLALCVLLASVGCGNGVTEGTWLNAPGWRRAQPVAHSQIPDPATLALDDEGALYSFVVDHVEAQNTLRVQKLDRQLNQRWQRDLDVRLNRGEQPQILWDGQRLHLLWIDANRLFSAVIDRNGQLDGAARLLSGELTAASYDAVVDSSGQVNVWFGGTDQQPGIYALQNVVSAAASPQLIDGEGYRPQLRNDSAGMLHAVWLHYPPGASQVTIFYASGDAAARPVAEFTVSFSASLEGPILGLDAGPEGGHAYVFWSILERTGLAAGSASTWHLAFPLAEPEAAGQPELLYVPAGYDLSYAAANGALQAGPRAALDGMGSRTTPLALWTNKLAAPELVVAARATVAYELRKEASQSALIYFRGGEPRAYQLLSFTRSNTVAPYVRSDARNNVYATWMEPGPDSGFVTYLGSTAPDVYAALSRIEAADVGRVLVEVLFGMLAGAALSPFAGIIWLIGPLFVLAVTSFLRRDDERRISRGTIVSLSLALVTFWLVKAATLPGFSEYVPFSSWVPFIPEWLEDPLRWIVTLLIVGTGLIVAWRFTYRRQAQSALNFMLIYAAVDSVLSMAIYGSIIYGAI